MLMTFGLVIDPSWRVSLGTFLFSGVAPTTSVPTATPTTTGAATSSIAASSGGASPVDWAALGVALLSLVFSVYLGIRQMNVQAHLAGIEDERRKDEIRRQNQQRDEERRANVSARWSHGRSSALIIVNEGPTAARNVAVTVQSRVPGRAPPSLGSNGQFEISQLNPGQDCVVPASIPYGAADTIEVFLNWIDDTGSRDDTVMIFVG